MRERERGGRDGAERERERERGERERERHVLNFRHNVSQRQL